MSIALDGAGSGWPLVLTRFERPAPVGVMARMALEYALPAGWVDEICEAHRQQQYSRELLWDCLRNGGQAAAATCGSRSLAGWNLCPDLEPSLPL
jgi:hypothetical protein